MIDSPLRETHAPGIFPGMKRRAPHREPAGTADVVRFRKALGRVIAEIRRGMEMPQSVFAEKLGLDQSTVAHAELGKHLWRLETWLQVSRVLKVPFYELFRRAGDLGTQSGVGMNRVVVALDPKEEVRLIHLWRQLTQEGRTVLMARAEACLELYRHGDNVVPLVHEARGKHHKAST